MRNLRAKLYPVTKLAKLLKEEVGQDLIEYALIVALVALGATAGMQSLANGINGAFVSVAATLNSSI